MAAIVDEICQISFLVFQSVQISASRDDDFVAISIESIELFVMDLAAEESRFHVLAVDDSLVDRKLIERLLRCSSFQVTAVDSGVKALEFLGLNKSGNDKDDIDDDYHDVNDDDDGGYDDEQQRDLRPVCVDSDEEKEVSLIITDYCMPEMTGYDLLKKIKESAALRNTPVVIMSSENVPSRINRCLEEGAKEFLLKPVQLSDMDRLKPHIMKQKSLDENGNGCSEIAVTKEIQTPDKLILGFNGLKLVAS